MLRWLFFRIFYSNIGYYEYICSRNKPNTQGKMIEYLSTNLWQLWAFVAAVCLIMELTNGDFFVICFAIGGLGAVIASLLGGNFLIGLIVFVVCSVLCLAFVRPKVKKRLHSGEDKRVSNADAIIGRTGMVSQDIEKGGYGRVALDGDDWKAEAADGSTITKGTKVRIVGRESIIIKVERA